MKKLTSVLLIILLLLSLLTFTSCTKNDPSQIFCEEIIAVYEDAGYSLKYHNHDDPIYYDFNEACHMEIYDPNDPEKNYIYITRYFTEEDAKAAYKEQQFNPILWLFFGIFGEWRWLHVRCYGNIVYSTFDYKMLFPMYKLILQQ